MDTIFFQSSYEYDFKTICILSKNSSDILFHSSSVAVLSEPTFGWEVSFVLFLKTPHIV